MYISNTGILISDTCFQYQIILLAAYTFTHWAIFLAFIEFKRIENTKWIIWSSGVLDPNCILQTDATEVTVMQVEIKALVEGKKWGSVDSG